jgi:hypothetical protein
VSSSFAYAPIHLRPDELEVLAGVFNRSRQGRSIPEDDLLALFLELVDDMAWRYREAIPHEEATATARETVDTLERIAELADDLERDAEALLQLLSIPEKGVAPLDERTLAALHARTLTEQPAHALLAEVAAWLGVRGDRMRELAKLSKAVRQRYPQRQRRGQIKAVAPYRAGEHVRALFRLFGIPYKVTAARDCTEESDAVQVLRIVSGIVEGRVEHYLP